MGSKYNQIIKGSYDEHPKRQFIRLSENGSVLPNKWALWTDDDYCDKCY